MSWVGVDVGGTFTDLVHYDPGTGRLALTKSPSTPDDPGRGVLNALTAAGVDLRSVERFRHGATVATNTALERRGALLGVITTRGFRDVLIVGRGNRTKLYDIKAVRAPGLVKRAHVLEVTERLGPTGEVLAALDEAQVGDAAARLGEIGVEAVVVCFLHAYANPAHERRALKIVREVLPGISASCSSDVLAEHREFERFATTALNAYVAPRMSRYLTKLGGALAAEGLEPTPEIMTSSGGSWTFEQMAALPINSMLSGPAGGVIGTLALGKALGLDNLISYDMGGTSTDTCLLRDGVYPLGSEGSIGGFPNRAPQIEINTVGAGGGSLAYLDEGGFLNVGPRSAGALPGPACYGHGGTEPTVTDANVVLGRFRPPEALGGEIEIDVGAAEQAVAALADRLNLDVAETAEGIIRIAVARMTGAIKEISVMRGIDPRDFHLVAFGGAGPLHAAFIAAELGMKSVIVPPLSGAFSALGLLMARRRKDRSQTRLMALREATLGEVRAAFEPLEASALAELEAEGFSSGVIRFERSVDLRFEGQAFELNTPVTDDMTSMDELVQAFLRVYEQRYAHADEGPIEAVSFRVAAYVEDLGGGIKLEWAEGDREPLAPPSDTASVTQTCRFDGVEHETTVLQRAALVPGFVAEGPLLVDEDGATTVVPPGFRLAVHGSGALFINRAEREGARA